MYINDLAFSVSNFNLNSLNENCILMKILLLTIIQLPDRQMTTIWQPYYINYMLLYMFYYSLLVRYSLWQKASRTFYNDILHLIIIIIMCIIPIIYSWWIVFVTFSSRLQALKYSIHGKILLMRLF